MRINKRLVISMGSVLVAAVLAFIILPRLYKNQDATMDVIAVNKIIKVGQQIKVNDLTKKTIGKYGVSKDVITDSNAVVGKYSTTVITPNDFLYPEKITDTLKKAEQTNALAKGKMLVTVTLNSTAAGLSGNIEKGDIVSVASCKKADNGEDANIQNYPELKDMEIYSVTNKALQDTSKVGTPTDIAQSESPAIPVNITFIATADQAKKLLQIEYSGNVHVILKEKAAKKRAEK